MRGPGCGPHTWFATEVLWAGHEMPLPSAHASLYLTGHPVASRVGTTSPAQVLCLTGAESWQGPVSSQPSGLETVPPHSDPAFPFMAVPSLRALRVAEAPLCD